MKFEIHHHHHDAGPIVAGLLVILMELKMISAEVQAVLDRAKQSTNLVQSVHLGMQGLQQQVADLKAKIDSLPTGNVLGDEDKAALQEAAGQLDNTIQTLKSDIPANTDKPDPNGQQDSGNSQPDQSGAQGSDGGAKPLAGTGQS